MIARGVIELSGLRQKLLSSFKTAVVQRITKLRLVFISAILGGCFLVVGNVAAGPTVYDVIVYDTTSSGIAAIKALAETAAYKNTKVNVMWIKQNPGDKENPGDQAMGQNGLNIEDYYLDKSLESGVVKQFRQLIDAYYGNTERIAGYSPYKAEANRQTFTNTAAKAVFGQMLTSPPLITGTTGIGLYDIYGYPKSYIYDKNNNLGTVTLHNGKALTAKYFIDASVEADLARVMGASYRLGMNETIFNDISGTKANYSNVITCTGAKAYDGSTKCTPTPFTSLLSLRLAKNISKNSTYKTTFSSTLYPKYNSAYFNNQFAGVDLMNPNGAKRYPLTCNVKQTIQYPLPSRDIRGDWYEFNQHWNDYRIPEGIVDWYLKPELRLQITNEITAVAKEAVSYLNKTCQQYVDQNGKALSGVQGFEIAETPINPYIRGEMRIWGQGNMTQSLLRYLSDSIGIGAYDPYDRRAGDFQVITDSIVGVNTQYAVEVSYMSLLPNNAQITQSPGLKNLIVSTAISTDTKTYNTPIRMESTRMMMGEAAGSAVALAKARGIAVNALAYTDVQKELTRKGVVLHW